MILYKKSLNTYFSITSVEKTYPKYTITAIEEWSVCITLKRCQGRLSRYECEMFWTPIVF